VVVTGEGEQFAGAFLGVVVVGVLPATVVVGEGEQFLGVLLAMVEAVAGIVPP
jgi:hypothetical protein